MAKEPKIKENYVNNSEMTEAFRNYSKESGKLPEYIGECFLRIANGLAKRPNFSRYTFREEMIMDAVENMVKAADSYDITTTTRSGKPNPFSYFTQIAWYAFLRRIAKENKQQEIKDRYIEMSGFDTLLGGGDEDHSVENEIVERLRTRKEKLSSKEPKVKKAKERTKDEVIEIDSPEGIFAV